MGISFTEVNGSAKKGGSYMKLENGINTFRMVGTVLPRYLYWVENDQKKSNAFECLGFNRELEKFTNSEKDWVRDTVKDDKGEPIKCSWSYAVQVINRKTGKLEILNLKKKMFEALIKFCRDAKRDPTDYEKGFDVVVERKKTGTFAYNVDYELSYVTMMTAGEQPLSEEDLELVKDLKSIDEVIPRPTPDEQKAALFAFLGSGTEESDAREDNSDARNEAINELDDL